MRSLRALIATRQVPGVDWRQINLSGVGDVKAGSRSPVYGFGYWWAVVARRLGSSNFSNLRAQLIRSADGITWTDVTTPWSGPGSDPLLLSGFWGYDREPKARPDGGNFYASNLILGGDIGYDDGTGVLVTPYPGAGYGCGYWTLSSADGNAWDIGFSNRLQTRKPLDVGKISGGNFLLDGGGLFRSPVENLSARAAASNNSRTVFINVSSPDFGGWTDDFQTLNSIAVLAGKNNGLDQSNVTFCGGLFWIVIRGEPAEFWYSSDGATWAQASIPNTTQADFSSGVPKMGFANGQWVQTFKTLTGTRSFRTTNSAYWVEASAATPATDNNSSCSSTGPFLFVPDWVNSKAYIST
jgi:hypothetical protein